jgi:thiol-disulfide isomerase/thioredoxin
VTARRARLWGGAVLAAATAVAAMSLRSPGSLGRAGLSLRAPTPPAPRVGSAAPDFALPELGGHAALSLSSLRGRPVLVNFWATWCPYCRREMPLLARLVRLSGGRVVVLGVDDTVAEPSVAQVRAYARRMHVNYPVLLDATGAVDSAFAVHAYPATFFVNAQGVVTGVVEGELTPALLQYELLRAGYKDAQVLGRLGETP